MGCKELWSGCLQSPGWFQRLCSKNHDVQLGYLCNLWFLGFKNHVSGCNSAGPVLTTAQSDAVMGRWDSECRHRAAPLPELQHKPLLHVQVAQPLFLSTWVGFIPSCSCVPQPRVMGWAQLPVPVLGAWGGSAGHYGRAQSQRDSGCPCPLRRRQQEGAKSRPRRLGWNETNQEMR